MKISLRKETYYYSFSPAKTVYVVYVSSLPFGLFKRKRLISEDLFEINLYLDGNKYIQLPDLTIG